MSVGFGGFEGAMFSIIPVMVIIIFVVVIGGFIFIAVKGASQWHQNNQSPILTVDAEVVAKRADVSSHMHSNGMNDGMSHHHSSTTYYYATFQVASGDRMEFPMASSEYGMLVEGDQGRLTFQGTRYQGFERVRQ